MSLLLFQAYRVFYGGFFQLKCRLFFAFIGNRVVTAGSLCAVARELLLLCIYFGIFIYFCACACERVGLWLLSQ